MRRVRALFLLALLSGASLSCTCARERSATPPASEPDAFVPLSPDRLHVTSGRVEPSHGAFLTVHSPMMRGVATAAAGSAVELAFEYRGPSHDTAPFASGEIRRQLGIKLRAADTCNVVYAMWYADTPGHLHVSAKHNAGKTRHQECGDGGYIPVTATLSRDVPALVPGAKHVLRAEIDGDRMQIIVDGAVAWVGELPPEVRGQTGPAGIRSDNVDFDFELRLPRALARD